MTTATRIRRTAPLPTIVETQRRTRGHAFLPPKAELRRLPDLGATDGTTPLLERPLLAKWFTGAWTWFAAEVSPEGVAFGYVVGPHGAEWGYFDLTELLEAVRPRSGTVTALATNDPVAGATQRVTGFSWVVERDCYFTPTNAATLQGA